MLRGIKKLVGPKSDDELQIQRYRDILQERSEPSPELHLKIGRLYEKIDEKANAGVEYKLAADLYMERGEYVGALVANKLLIRLDRQDADANANVAFIELQQGVTLSQQELETFLADVGQPLQSSRHVNDDSPPKTSRSRLALNRNSPSKKTEQPTPVFQAHRQQLVDLISGDDDAEERFDASFNTERQSLVETIKEELGDERSSGEHSSRTESQPATEEAEIDDMPFIDLSKDSSPVPSLCSPDRSDEIGPTESERTIDTPEPKEQTVPPERADSNIGSDSRDFLPLLARNPLFSMLSNADLKRLRSYVYLCDVPQGRAIGQSFDEEQSLFVLLEGEVVLKWKAPDSEGESGHIFLQAGDFWGEHDFLGQTWIEFSPVAKVAATIAEIPSAFLAPIAKKHPSLLDLLKKTCKRRCFSPFLRRVSIFEDLSPDDIQHVAECLFTKKMTQGSVLIQEGECDESIFFIRSGEVDVRLSLVEREDLQVVKMESTYLQLACLGKGDFFGEGAYFAQEPRSATIVAKTDGSLFKLPGSHLKKLLQYYPQLESRLRQCHEQRVQATLQTITRELT